MRIRRAGSDSPPPPKEKIQATGVNMKHSAFFDSLQEYERGQRYEALPELLSAVDEAAKRLCSGRNMSNLRAYREAVQEFLKEAVSGSYRVRGEYRWDRRGNRRALYLVEKVNQKLEELAIMVLKNHENAIKIMGKMDEIRGLLIDLYY